MQGLGNLITAYGGKKKVKNETEESGANMFNNLIAKVFSSATQEFHNTFRYGQRMKIIHKERPKEMTVYLDTYSQNLLWFSSMTKAFLIDLYFTTAFFKRYTIPNENLGTDKFFFALKYLEIEVIFVFDDERENNNYFNLFTVYIGDLRKKYPNYTLYFSNIKKLHALHATKTGAHTINYSQIMEISQKVGLKNKKQNQQILNLCLKYNNIEGTKKGITTKCFDDYFEAQFCNRKIQPIFELYAKEKLGLVNKDPRVILRKTMQPDEFQQFLTKVQKEDSQYIKTVLEKYKGDLSFFDFCRYLYDSEYNNVSRIPQVDQDYPLKDYFCYSSHNTYLSGNQITSDSQVERYAEDLENGIKCVEIDIHNDTNGKPIVNHAIQGFGLSKPIDFEEVIKVIKTYSEKCVLEDKYHYPIILSLENHASNENNQIMLQNITTHFKDKLFMVTGNESNFPSLSYLRGKILLKTNSTYDQLRHFKKTGVVKKLTTFNSDYSDFDTAHKPFVNKNLQKRYEQFEEYKIQLTRRKYGFNARIQKQEQIFALLPVMTKVTTIFKSTHGIKEKQLSQFGCTSLTNGQVMKGNPEEIIKYTKTSWLRTYPFGMEIQSANYDPAPMLAVGAQIIALNTQTKDDFAWMLHGYFIGGDSSALFEKGYVLKPERLRHRKNKEAIEISEGKENKSYILSIQIIESSGQIIKIRFHGLKEDIQRNLNATNNFYYTNPDQSFIIFDIGEKYKNCVAIRWILEGYRILEGKDKENYMDCGRRILLKVTKTLA